MVEGVEPGNKKLLQINLPGTTLFLDWRYSKILVVYKFLCLILDTVNLVFGVTKAILESFYRVVVSNRPKKVEGSLALITGSGHGIGKYLHYILL